MNEDKEKILFWIYYHGGRATVGQIQRHMQRITQDQRYALIDSLIADGYIERERVHKAAPGRWATLLVLARRGERHIDGMLRKGAIDLPSSHAGAS